MTQPSKEPTWHALTTEEAVKATGSHAENGLTQQQAGTRLAEEGANELPQRAAQPVWKRFLRQFNNLLISVLLIAGILAGLLGEWLDMAVIMAVVLTNAIIGFVQEGKAEKALHAIQGMLSLNALVIRDGQRQQIAARELVKGDVVVLEAGAKVPADIRVLKSSSLAVQEAALTGESVAVDKNEPAVDDATALAERSNMLYSGTLVTQGQGRGVVVATGKDTELGRIDRMLADVQELTTPLLRQMAQFSRYLTAIILAVAVLVFLLGWLRGNDISFMFMAVVSLVVAAIPEGLPVILTVALAIGVTRMASRHAVIRRLPAVETLGAVSVICSDKTGTLTRNEMTVAHVRLADALVDISGTGYAPQGEFSIAGESLPDTSAKIINQLARVAVLCNDSALQQKDGQWQVSGDPMEGALLTLAAKAGLTQDELTRQSPRLADIPFDSRYKYMVTAHQHEQGVELLVKGAPEKIIDMCSSLWDSGQALSKPPLDRDWWKAQVDALAADGQRVLALACTRRDTSEPKLSHDDLADMQLLGLVALLDPPRDEAIAAVKACHQAGISVKMITGDHAATASAIGQRLGLHKTEHALTGAELDTLDDAALNEAVNDTDVFARTTPEHKLRLVGVLQAQNNVVAMTGDGVNDAPALKRADVGIAMGRGGTEAAREASEMVLVDDNFASIVNAVHEGRTVYDNLKKAITFLLPINGGESLAIMLALIFALTLPIMPLQILWVNMVSSIVLALGLAFEASERDVMKRPPRPPREPWLTPFLLWRVAFVSVLFTIGIFAIFQWTLAQGHGEAYARTMAVNTLIAMEVWYLFSVRYLRRSSLFWQGIQGTKHVLIAVCTVFLLQLLFTYAPFMQSLFDTAGLQLQHGFICVGIGIALFAVLELEKWAWRRVKPETTG